MGFERTSLMDELSAREYFSLLQQWKRKFPLDGQICELCHERKAQRRKYLDVRVLDRVNIQFVCRKCMCVCGGRPPLSEKFKDEIVELTQLKEHVKNLRKKLLQNMSWETLRKYTRIWGKECKK